MLALKANLSKPLRLMKNLLSKPFHEQKKTKEAYQAFRPYTITCFSASQNTLRFSNRAFVDMCALIPSSKALVDIAAGLNAGADAVDPFLYV